MSQVVASQVYCLENSNYSTRPGSDAFFRIDGNHAPKIIDQHQAKRLYRLQEIPNANTRVHLDSSHVGYDAPGHFESLVCKQIDESVAQPTTKVYHQPTDMSNESMAKFSFGKARIDPLRIIPSQTTIVRNHPSALPVFQPELSSNHPVILPFINRSIPDRRVRCQLGPGGTLNPGEDGKQTVNYLRKYHYLPSQHNLSYIPRRQQYLKKQELERDELARHYMYTSVQQAAFDDIAWDDSKLPSILPPTPSTTYDTDDINSRFKSKSLSSLYDKRTWEVLDWDHQQTRNVYFDRTRMYNVPPLPRAEQISGYSGSIDGNHIQDIDNPKVDFKPYTKLRTKQPKVSLTPIKPNMPYYTGKTHWTKIDPVSHCDQTGRAYTTTAAVHKSFPIDDLTYRHSGINGEFSRIVTTVMPQNSFNKIDKSNETINASLDSRPYIILQQLPRKCLHSPKQNSKMTEEENVHNEVKN